MKKFSKYTVDIEFEGRKYTEQVEKDSFVIGRSSDCDVHIDSKNLSRHHLRVSLVGSEIFVEDLKSTNGSFLDGVQLEPNKLKQFSSDKVLHLGKHEDVILDLRAEFVSHKEVNKFFVKEPPREIPQDSIQENSGETHSAKEVRDSLKQVFNKDPMSLHDPAPPKAERDYKGIMNQVEILKTEIIERAEKRADKILTDAKDAAEKVIEETKKKSEELMVEARANADRMVSDAVEQSKNVKEQTDLADLLREIDEKKNEVERVNEIIAKCRENLKSLEIKNTEYLALEEKNTNLELNIRTLESRASNLIENQKDIEGQISISSQELEKILKEKENVKNISSEVEKKHSQISQEVSSREIDVNKLADLKVQLEKDISSLQDKKKEIEKLAATIVDLNQEIDAKGSEFKSLLLEIQDVNAELKSIKDIEKNLQAESSNQKTQIESDKANIENLKKEYEEFFEKKKSLLLEIDEISNQKNSTMHELAELQKNSDALEKECSTKIKRASDEADLILSQAKANAQAEQIALIQKSKQDILDKEDSLLAHAKIQAKEMIDKAKAEVERLEAQAQKINNEMISKVEVKAEKLLKESQARADELRDKAQAEYQKQIKDAEHEAEKIKVTSIQVMEEKKKDFVELEKKRIRKSSDLLKSELNVLLYSKMKLHLKDDNDEHMARIKASLEAAVNSSMLNEVLENDSEMYALLDDQVLKQQQKSKNYWRHTVPGVFLSLIAVYFAVPFIKEKIKDKSREVASVAKQESVERVKQKEEEAKEALFEHFKPKMAKEFKDNYTDRVLYTEKYATLSLSKDYREDWILELQNFFVDELELSENALVPYISQEANMIRELVDQSKKINGRFIDQGIDKMREIEADFIKKLKTNLNSDADFKKINKFQKKFFEKKVKQAS